MANMVKLKINLKGTLVFDELPQLYADLMDTPQIESYLTLAKQIKRDAIQFKEIELKLLDKTTAVLKENELALVKLSKLLTDSIQVVIPDHNQEALNPQKVQDKEISKINKKLWRNLFTAINIDYEFMPKISEVINKDFNEQTLLECLQKIDTSLSAETARHIYEKLSPRFSRKVLNNGDVLISLNTHPISEIVHDAHSFMLKHKDFHWLMNFIAFNNKNPKFNTNRLTIRHADCINNPHCFNEYGFTIKHEIFSKKLLISKEHLPFLEEQIGFQVKN